MNHDAFRFNFSIDEENITVVWKRLPEYSSGEALSRYPELEISFNYREISSDTVRAMLRDMEVPPSISKAIMTRVESHAA